MVRQERAGQALRILLSAFSLKWCSPSYETLPLSAETGGRDGLKYAHVLVRPDLQRRDYEMPGVMSATPETIKGHDVCHSPLT